MNKIYHYTSFENFKKIIEFGTIRLNSLKNVDDAEEGFLLDFDTEAPYTFVSCWTNDSEESIPLWCMYVDSPFAIRLGVSTEILKPQFFKEAFISNHTNRNSYVFLRHRGGNRGLEFLSDIVYKEQPRLRKLQDYSGNFDKEYISSYGLTKSLHWKFQKEVRFMVQAVPVRQVTRRDDASLYRCCLEAMDNSKPTNIDFIDMKYDLKEILSADIMLGPSTDKNDENILNAYLKKYLPNFSGKISRSSAYIRKK